MTIAQKCNCCIHEEICNKKDAYVNACKQVKHNIPVHILDNIMSINISCKYFQAKAATTKEMVGEG